MLFGLVSDVEVRWSRNNFKKWRIPFSFNLSFFSHSFLSHK